MNHLSIKDQLNEIGSRSNSIRHELLETGKENSDRIWADCAQIIANAQAIQTEVSNHKIVQHNQEGATSHD
jgi:ribosomal protein L18E